MSHAELRSSGKATSGAAEMRAHLKRLLAEEEVALSAELAELLRHRELKWSLIPEPSRALVMPCLTLKETLRLDTAVTERGDEKNPRDRDHLMKAYNGLRSAGFDAWTFKDTNAFEGVRWARKRDMNLQNLKLEYKGERDGDKVLGELVLDENEDLATYYAARSEARDTDVVGLEEEWAEFDECDSTTLIEALRKGYLEVAKCLIDRGAHVNKVGSEDRTPLHIASQKGHLEVVLALLDAKAEVNKTDGYNMIPLHCASEEGHLEVVKALLDAKAEVNKTASQDMTPLHVASWEGHLEVVRALLDAKAEVNKACRLGGPLSWAAMGGHLEVVKALLAAEADVNKADDTGVTPLSQALSNNHPEVAALLREAGAHE